MLGELVTSVLVLVLGYAYPAIECFKTMERNNVHMNELRFWCQYWIVLAFLAVFERVGEIFLSWVPMYAEVKLGLIIYLWYPKTKGTAYVYERFVRPYIMRHGTNFDKKLLEWRNKAWDFAIYYWENCTELGQSAFLQIVQYFVEGRKKKGNDLLSKNKKNHSPPTSPTPDSVLTRTLLDMSEFLNSQPGPCYDDPTLASEKPRPRSWFRRSKHH